ncbi:hypothetical protein [Sorangium sp. So ce1024]|uniref:hypothetical protein n=1 Tax=Sorangium sp. So ce1024 TaxID=3133327 RepID=UPI003F0E177C
MPIARSAGSLPLDPIPDFLESSGDGILPGMTVEQIVAAVRSLPVPDRPRVTE